MTSATGMARPGHHLPPMPTFMITLRDGATLKVYENSAVIRVDADSNVTIGSYYTPTDLGWVAGMLRTSRAEFIRLCRRDLGIDVPQPRQEPMGWTYDGEQGVPGRVVPDDPVCDAAPPHGIRSGIHVVSWVAAIAPPIEKEGGELPCLECGRMLRLIPDPRRRT